MKIILTGTGTSQGIPIIGCECQVCTSSNRKDKRLRTAALFSQNGINLAIDVGPDFRQQMLAQNVKELHGILITHAHNDHIIGLDDVRPFNFRQKKKMKVFATEPVQAQLKQRFGYAFEANPYPGAPGVELVTINKNTAFKVAGIKIIPIEVMHGKLPVLGFRFGDITYLTDVKTMQEEEIQKAINTKVLVLSALHQSEHHSHLSLQQALDLIEKIKPEQAYLTHLSHAMGLHEEVSKLLPHNVQIGYDGLELTA